MRILLEVHLIDLNDGVVVLWMVLGTWNCAPIEPGAHACKEAIRDLHGVRRQFIKMLTVVARSWYARTTVVSAVQIVRKQRAKSSTRSSSQSTSAAMIVSALPRSATRRSGSD